MIRFSCPNCKTVIQTGQAPASGMLTCPSCGRKLHVNPPPPPPKPPAESKTPRLAAPPPPAPPSTPRTQVSAPRQAARPTPAAMDHDYQPPKSPNHTAMILAIGGVGAAIVLGLVAIIVVLLLREDRQPEQVVIQPQTTLSNPPALPPPPDALEGGRRPAAPSPAYRPPSKPAAASRPPVQRPPSDPGSPPSSTPPAGSAPDASPPPGGIAKDSLDDLPSLGSSSGSGASGQEVYQYALKSVTLIFNVMDDGISMGSGSLVDKKNRIVLTNHHVIEGNRELFVFFPAYRNGKLVTEGPEYLKAVRSKEDLIRAKVLVSTRTKDLALLELDRLPDGVEALPLAETLVAPGQSVHSIGNPGGTDALWIYTSGTVRQLSRKKWRSGSVGGLIYENEADVIETQSPTNRGDSGGPLMNDRGELVGVTQGGSRAANLLSIFISVTEVRTLIEDHFRQKGTRWVSDARPPLRTGRAGPSTSDLATIIKHLEHKDPILRAKAAGLLGEVGPDGRLGVPGLIKLLADPDPLVRRIAGEALAKIGPPDAVDVDLLVATLDDPMPAARLYAADSLGKMGPEARVAIPKLIAHLKRDDVAMREACARSLGRMGSEAKDQVLQALEDCLEDGQPPVRRAAAEGITLLAPRDATLALKLLNHKDPNVRIQGAHALAGMGKEAKGALADLLAAAKAEHRGLRKAALEALGSLGGEAKGAGTIFLEALTDSDKEIRTTAIQFVPLLGAESRAAVPALVESLKDPAYQKDAIVALGKIGPPARAAAQPLAELLRTSDRNTQELVLTAIGGLGAEGKAAVVTLIGLYRNSSRDSSFRQRVTETLGKIGKPAVPALINALKDSDPEIVMGAVVALGEIGPNAREAVATLRLVPQHWNGPTVREDVDAAIRRIQGK